MRLIGSRTEDLIRAELVESHRALFFEPAEKRLLDALRKCQPGMTTAYVLGWTPEQCSDAFSVLVDVSTIVSVELDRASGDVDPVVLLRMPVVEFAKGLGRPARIRLAIAQELAAADMQGHAIVPDVEMSQGEL